MRTIEIPPRSFELVLVTFFNPSRIIGPILKTILELPKITNEFEFLKIRIKTKNTWYKHKWMEGEKYISIPSYDLGFSFLSSISLSFDLTFD